MEWERRTGGRLSRIAVPLAWATRAKLASSACLVKDEGPDRPSRSPSRPRRGRGLVWIHGKRLRRGKPAPADAFPQTMLGTPGGEESSPRSREPVDRLVFSLTTTTTTTATANTTTIITTSAFVVADLSYSAFPPASPAFPHMPSSSKRAAHDGRTSFCIEHGHVESAGRLAPNGMACFSLPILSGHPAMGFPPCSHTHAHAFRRPVGPPGPSCPPRSFRDRSLGLRGVPVLTVNPPDGSLHFTFPFWDGRLLRALSVRGHSHHHGIRKPALHAFPEACICTSSQLAS